MSTCLDFASCVSNQFLQGYCYFYKFEPLPLVKDSFRRFMGILQVRVKWTDAFYAGKRWCAAENRTYQIQTRSSPVSWAFLSQFETSHVETFWMSNDTLKSSLFPKHGRGWASGTRRHQRKRLTRRRSDGNQKNAWSDQHRKPHNTRGMTYKRYDGSAAGVVGAKYNVEDKSSHLIRWLELQGLSKVELLDCHEPAEACRHIDGCLNLAPTKRPKW